MTDLQKQKLKRVPNAAKLLAYFKMEDLPKVYGRAVRVQGRLCAGPSHLRRWVVEA